MSGSYKLNTVWLLQPNSKEMPVTNAFFLHLLYQFLPSLPIKMSFMTVNKLKPTVFQ